jgi:hypothetical protein
MKITPWRQRRYEFELELPLLPFLLPVIIRLSFALNDQALGITGITEFTEVEIAMDERRILSVLKVHVFKHYPHGL